jgi:hypothetical protein
MVRETFAEEKQGKQRRQLQPRQSFVKFEKFVYLSTNFPQKLPFSLKISCKSFFFRVQLQV